MQPDQVVYDHSIKHVDSESIIKYTHNVLDNFSGSLPNLSPCILVCKFRKKKPTTHKDLLDTNAFLVI